MESRWPDKLKFLTTPEWRGSFNEFEKQLELLAHPHKVESPYALNFNLENLIAYKRRKVNIQI